MLLPRPVTRDLFRATDQLRCWLGINGLAKGNGYPSSPERFCTQVLDREAYKQSMLDKLVWIW